MGRMEVPNELDRTTDLPASIPAQTRADKVERWDHDQFEKLSLEEPKRQRKPRQKTPHQPFINNDEQKVD